VAVRQELARAIAEELGEPIGRLSAILDAGCGTGWWLERLASDGGDKSALHGVDLDPERVAAARARCPSARIEVGDARRLPYAEGSFDAVLLSVVLSSLKRPAGVLAALSEARRVLAPWGVLIIYEPRLPNPLNPRTHVVRDADFDAAGLLPRSQRTLTLLPPVGRRLGALTPLLHPALSRLPFLRSHRLIAYRK
jgi:ubiquinone/menaquinone biosynthesis C-methylase UbiE